MPDIRWRGQEHQTLYNWINSGPGATASTPQLDYWGGLKQSLADIGSKLNSTLNDIGANWEGMAGRSATAGLTPLQQWADEAQSSADVMSSSAQDQADHVATARAAMPEPQKVPTGAPAMWQLLDAADTAKHGDQGPAKVVAQQAADHEQQETAAADAHERAIQVMSNYQANSENNAATLGVFGAPPDIKVAVRMPDGSDSIGVGYALGNAPMVRRADDGGPQVTPSGMAADPSSATVASGGPSATSAATGTAASSGTAAAGTAAGGGTGVAAAAALGGVGALGGIAARLAPLSKGGTVGTATAGNRGNAKDDEEQTRPSTTKSTGMSTGTAPSTGQHPSAIGAEAGSMPPPISGAGTGAGGMTGVSPDTVRGANQYLTASPSSAGGDGDLRRFATGGAGGDISGAHGAGAAGSMMPPGGAGMGGAGMGGAGGVGGQQEVHESASYLVEADDIFDDGRMVAPPVLGGDEDQR